MKLRRLEAIIGIKTDIREKKEKHIRDLTAEKTRTGMYCLVLQCVCERVTSVFVTKDTMK